MYCYSYLLLLLIDHLLSNIFMVETAYVNRFPFIQYKTSKGTKMVMLNNGDYCPLIGMGTWMGRTNISDDERVEIYDAVKNAIDVGYRHFDCASIYNNEKSVGKAIIHKINEGVVKRKDLFVTSKLWNNKHNPSEVEGELRKSLKNLGLKYLNLYLIHWPFSITNDPLDSEGRCTDGNISFIKTWGAMERCVQLGLTKSIGISNFNVRQMNAILNVAKIKPVVNQVESHPFLTQNKLIEFCERNDIRLMAYGPLGSPYRNTNPKNVSDAHFVKQMAYKYNKTPAQILIKFQIQRGIIVIPKSTHPQRQIENLRVWDFEMTKDEIYILHSLNQNLRYVLYPSAKHLKEYPFNEENYE